MTKMKEFKNSITNKNETKRIFSKQFISNPGKHPEDYNNPSGQLPESKCNFWEPGKGDVFIKKKKNKGKKTCKPTKYDRLGIASKLDKPKEKKM